MTWRLIYLTLMSLNNVRHLQSRNTKTQFITEKLMNAKEVVKESCYIITRESMRETGRMTRDTVGAMKSSTMEIFTRVII